MINKTLNIFKNFLSERFIDWCSAVVGCRSPKAVQEFIVECLEPSKKEILSNEYYFYMEYFEEVQLDTRKMDQYFKYAPSGRNSFENKQDIEHLINHLVKIKIKDMHIYNVFEDKEYEVKVKLYIEEKIEEKKR